MNVASRTNHGRFSRSGVLSRWAGDGPPSLPKEGPMVRVADLMQTDVRTIHQDAPVSEAIVLLADGHVSGLPVLNDAQQLVGVISSSDILAAEAESDAGEALDRVASYARVGDLMRSEERRVGKECRS